MMEHGGNIYRLAEELKIQERKIIDFSASINPLGISKKVKAEIRKNLKYLNKYPDPESKRLRRYIAQYHGIEPEMILCGNGSTELIYLIIRALKPERVLIPAPTFSEYERACRIIYGLRVTSYELKKENNFDINTDEFITTIEGGHSKLQTPNSNPPFPHLLKVGVGGLSDMAFLCNPNNPTGRLLKRESVLKIADAARRQNCYLVVDEAFIDFCPEDSVINIVRDNPYLIVLRSMTKFYALSGLRIGYGVFPSQLIERLKAFKEPWSVNSLAQRAAVVALKDKAYRAETYRLIKEEKRFIENRLKRMGIKYFPSKTNFYLLRLDERDGIYKQLGKKGILVRDCSDFKGLGSSYIRIAVKSRRENNILLRSLAEYIKERRWE